MSKSLEEQYRKELVENPKYSLRADPEGKYGMSEIQKRFVEHYVNFKSIGTAAEFAGIDLDKAKEFYVAYDSQQEIRRINLAMYHQQFNARMLSLEEIGGYLSSIIVDTFVAEADKVKTMDKVRISQMIIDLHKLKTNSLTDPQSLMMKDLDSQIKNLSLATIEALIKQATKKPNTYEVEVDSSLTPEESAYLSTLPASDLLNIIDDATKTEKIEMEKKE